MKNQPFRSRLGYAWLGIRIAWQQEASFRVQATFGLAALLALPILRPAAVWWGLIPLTVGAVLAAELFNTALESIVDRLHPDRHPAIGLAKDCAAGAVLILSLASLGVAAAMIGSILF